jgi:hypothetical protein
MRRPLVIYDFATAPFRISFLSVYSVPAPAFHNHFHADPDPDPIFNFDEVWDLDPAFLCHRPEQ